MENALNISPDLSFSLSILDLAATGKGYTATQALNASVKLAKLADQRSFNRYWVAEHHSMPAALLHHQQSSMLFRPRKNWQIMITIITKRTF